MNAVWRCDGWFAFTSAPRATSIRTASTLPLLAHVMSGVSPVAIGVFGFGAGLQEELDERGACVGACQGQRSDAIVVCRVDVCASADQEARCPEIIPVGGPEERRRATIRSEH